MQEYEVQAHWDACEPSGAQGSYRDLCEPGSPGKLDRIYCCFWFIVLIRGNEQGESKSGRAKRMFAGAGKVQ